MATEPTILVKKADGSFERMPLSQVQKMKQGASNTAIAKAPAPQAPKAVLEQNNKPAAMAQVAKPANSFVPKTPPPLAPHPIRPRVLMEQAKVSVPVKNITPTKLPTSPNKPVTNIKSPDDFSHPFEDLPGSVDKSSGITPDSREDDAQKVMDKLSFKVPAAVMARAYSAITLLLKDVRTADQTKSIALRSQADGGLGLTPAQTDELIRESEALLNKNVKPIDKKLAAESRSKVMDSLTNTAGFVHPPSALSKPAAPVKVPSVNSEIKAPPELAPLPGRPNAPIFSGGNNNTTRLGMTDVTAPASVEVGPVDEVRMVSLTDFRRLSQNPVEAAARLGQKFENLKAESILLYFSALDAWHQSPLYRDYLGSVIQAINKRTRLSAVLGGSADHISMPEIEAILGMEKNLGI